MTHCSALELKSSWLRMAGSATLVMEISSTTMNCAIATSEKVSQGERCFRELCGLVLLVISKVYQ